MNVVPLPGLITANQHGKWHWHCPHCGQLSRVGAVKKMTAIRRLDKHVTMKHSRYEPLEVSDGNQKASRP